MRPELRLCSFENAIKEGGLVRGLNVSGQAAMPRKKIDKLTETAKTYGAKGLAYLAVEENGSFKSSFAKFMSAEELDRLVKAMDGKPGDLLLLRRINSRRSALSLGAVRLQLGAELGLIKENQFAFTWITEFPPLSGRTKKNRFMAMHHPFTMPMLEDWDKIDSDPRAVRAEAYDIVLNGTELGGGSVRIHMDDVQEKNARGSRISKEQAEEQFWLPYDCVQIRGSASCRTGLRP